MHFKNNFSEREFRILFFLMMLKVLIILTQGLALAPFIYSIF